MADEPRRKIIAENRRARYDYFIDEVIEAGLVLTGTEVKALRQGKANIAEAYATDEGGEIYLINANIPEYTAGNRENHTPKRPRKLLLHRREMAKLSGLVQRKGYSLIPLKLYFNERGRAKLELGIGRGKKMHDKRETEQKRDWGRQKQRWLRERG